MKFLRLLLCFLLSASGALWAAPPNILVILVDDLGYGDLSCMGAKDLKSPHVDRLASEGVVLDSFYANCPVCTPTRAALLTGRYPDRVGAPGVIRTHPESNFGWLAPSATLIPTPLKAAGYRTAIIGKWHLGLEAPNTPMDRGFDHFHGFLGDMMDDYYTHQRHGIDYMYLDRELIHPEGHATDLFSNWASEYVRKGKDRDQPWFLYLAYNAPHTPIQPPEEWTAKVLEREPGIDEKRAKLVALIEHMDEGIGKVLATIDATGQREETLVIFTSDNGGQGNVGGNNGAHRGAKQDMYEGGIKVPFCARWPGRITAGSKSSVRGITMDLFPTVLEAAGAGVDADLHAGIEGRSILASLTGTSQPEFAERDLFWVRREGNMTYMGDSSWAMRRGPWKLVKNRPDGPWEMFNLEADPLEKKDFLRGGPKPKEWHPMAAEMRKFIQIGGTVPWQKPDPFGEE